MKTKIFLRIAKTKQGKLKVAASTKPNSNPVKSQEYYGRPGDPLPTISFGIVVNLPEDAFNQAEKILGELSIKSEDITPAVGVEASEDNQ